MSLWAGINSVQKTICVYSCGMGLNFLLTNSIKLYVGYLKPNFYEYCLPDESFQECTSTKNSSGRFAFPSGSASNAFCGLTLISFFLEQRFGITRLRTTSRKEPPRLRRIASLLCYTPMLLATFISASRVADNKHFPADIVGAAVLGGFVASLVHSIWFPLWSDDFF